MRRFLLRVLSVFRRRRADADLEREIASHLSLLEDEYRRRGAGDGEARLAARRAMGSVALAKDLHRDARAFVWLDDLRQDLRLSLRLLRRDPLFTTIAVLTLGLGIGVNTAIFSLVNGVLVRPLPYEGSERLVRIAEYFPLSATGSPLAPRTMLNGAELEALQSARTLSDVGVYGGRPFSMTLARPDGAIRLAGEQISPAVFRMLRARPILGRIFEPREDMPGADAVVVLSYTAWFQHFDARDDIVGRVLPFDGRGYTVVGVMPRGFEFPDPQSAFWVPFVRSPAAGGQDTGVSIGRIADGHTRREAIAEVSAILSR